MQSATSRLKLANMWFPTVLAVLAVTVSAAPQSQRIVGGTLTTIDNYPYQAALLRQQSLNWFVQSCGGTILNNRAILTAAHCFDFSTLTIDNRFRVGSTYANSGGVVHNVNQIIIHPSYNQMTFDTDIAIVWVAPNIVYNNQVQPGSIAGTNYNLADNQVVWAIGWGLITPSGPLSEQLRHVQIWTVNQQICNQRYGGIITDNMLCSGWLDVGGRDQCSNDSGGPLLHNGVVVGICSFGAGCASPTHPGVNTKVSRFTTWIQANA